MGIGDSRVKPGEPKKHAASAALLAVVPSVRASLSAVKQNCSLFLELHYLTITGRTHHCYYPVIPIWSAVECVEFVNVKIIKVK